MFDFLPDEKKRMLLEYPFAKAFAEGKVSGEAVYTFLEDMKPFEDELKGKGIIVSAAELCVERIALSDAARAQRHIILATREQLERFAQQRDLGDYVIRVIKGNAAIGDVFFPAGAVLEPAKDDRTFYVVLSDDLPELPDLMGRLKSWIRIYTRPLFYKGIVMVEKEHYNKGVYSHSENLRGGELDITKKIPMFTRDELFIA